MNRHLVPRAVCLCAVIFTLDSVFPADLCAANPLTIVRVEEDWELRVLTPDPNSAGPQVTCVFSPTGGVGSIHATFEMNHQSIPQYQAGGLHLQAWNGANPLTAKSSPSGELLNRIGETVRWTQCMELSDGAISFEILAGTSATWGSFGGQGNLKTQLATSLSNLNGYDPAISAKHSGVGYAANRVQALVLLRVRLVTDTNEVIEHNTASTVYLHE